MISRLLSNCDVSFIKETDNIMKIKAISTKLHNQQSNKNVSSYNTNNISNQSFGSSVKFNPVSSKKLALALMAGISIAIPAVGQSAFMKSLQDTPEQKQEQSPFMESISPSPKKEKSSPQSTQTTQSTQPARPIIKPNDGSLTSMQIEAMQINARILSNETQITMDSSSITSTDSSLNVLYYTKRSAEKNSSDIQRYKKQDTSPVRSSIWGSEYSQSQYVINNLNQQIAQLELQKSAYLNEIAALQQENSYLNGRLNALNIEIAKLQNKAKAVKK